MLKGLGTGDRVLLDALQRDCLLRASTHTLATGLTSVLLDEQGLLPAMNEALELALYSEAGAQLLRQGSDNEDANRAYADAVCFPFAAIAINDRPKSAGFVLALSNF